MPWRYHDSCPHLSMYKYPAPIIRSFNYFKLCKGKPCDGNEPRKCNSSMVDFEITKKFRCAYHTMESFFFHAQHPHINYKSHPPCAFRAHPSPCSSDPSPRLPALSSVPLHFINPTLPFPRPPLSLKPHLGSLHHPPHPLPTLRMLLPHPHSSKCNKKPCNGQREPSKLTRVPLYLHRKF